MPARGPRPAARAAALPQPPAPAGGTQLQMRGPGESRHFDKAHWVASKITGQALQQARVLGRVDGEEFRQRTASFDPRHVGIPGKLPGDVRPRLAVLSVT